MISNLELIVIAQNVSDANQSFLQKTKKISNFDLVDCAVVVKNIYSWKIRLK